MIKNIKIKKNFDIRLDKYLKNLYSSLTQGFVERNIRKKNILINDSRTKANYIVKLNDNLASLRPIAGTLPRGLTSEEDEKNAITLLADPKESAEHVMLVDLARNDLGRVAEAGSIYVEPYRKIEHYSHVMHIVSGVQGKLASNFDQFDLFAATFPAGTLVGAPKVRAMQIIEEMELVGRGFYGGTAGYFGLSGDMDQAITIRTLVFSNNEYSFQAGAGIVADSVPSKEYQEVLAKSAILRNALEIAKDGF